MFVKTIQIKTKERNEMVLITNQVRDIVQKSSINNGLIQLFVPHTTAAVTINENADPDVKTDMINGLGKISPDDPAYKHMEGNSDAHIKSSLVGVDQQIILSNGEMILGTWQGIYFCEFDGPRMRNLVIAILPANKKPSML